MDFRQSLTKRIVIVFALMSALVAGVFAVGIIATVHVVERKLTTTSLGGGLNRLLQMDDTSEWHHQPEKDELFFVEGGQGALAMDPELEALAPGFQEIQYQGEDFYAMAETVDGRRYVLLRNQLSLEQREHVLFAVVIVGFVLSILLAILLGWLLARRVMAPVIRLAHQVRHRDQLLELAPPLHRDYAVDEVGELALSFDQTLGRLRAALIREKLFTSDVSHELRTPLMVLASSCELLLSNASLDPRSSAQVSRIARASDEMRQLVETFLMLARAREDSGSGASATLKEVADALAEVWGRLIREKGIEFIYDVEHTSPTRYNLTFLQSVMGNLLRNAWHYTDRGYVRLTLREHGFCVEDSGIGISEEKRHAMFQPFVRGDESRGEGLGLGLSLVQRICDKQQWRVELNSLQPNGCCFTVELTDA
ncbi:MULTISPECIES: HAMP domain-containing sensor histidine kinase [unclassified Pseudomonas]|uniref:sensor histidine kinase n=1 Tax=unclassified Pseudomonas TaxID=196821 RepID=UPI002AC99DEB|nr:MULTISPECIES: HAMP domain-containing sensor histidine kinase [unclassified Pseudomonas]MEB0047511.1 HAMP domain-containing sensor histidine kinase [Pseudomonas sp. Dout3]MEB0097954.1 HAMP domain-containing sensor histidine kinase [Pseudomonas sp. DC1.2]WPX56982.1 HAMP domain-containing sensor histidine kinase [Pseudomonas sp. DC1.2]